MKRTVAIILLVYYLFGTLCLPRGNFSVMQDLPEMYRHCQATEDKDMTPLDFITDHLINIDCIFDKHDNGDEQKPHTPIQFNHAQQQVVFTAQQFIFSIIEPCIYKNEFHAYPVDLYLYDYISRIFRPPMC